MSSSVERRTAVCRCFATFSAPFFGSYTAVCFSAAAVYILVFGFLVWFTMFMCSERVEEVSSKATVVPKSMRGKYSNNICITSEDSKTLSKITPISRQCRRNIDHRGWRGFLLIKDMALRWGVEKKQPAAQGPRKGQDEVEKRTQRRKNAPPQKKQCSEKADSLSCSILVNFGRILHIFAFSCVILLNFAWNFPKHPKKTVKWQRKHPKLSQKRAKIFWSWEREFRAFFGYWLSDAS